MKLYPKLAFEAMKKNKRLYLPFLLTCIGMVMMFYIITYIQYTDALEFLPGSAVITYMIDLGGWIISLFSAIFLFYTNTFLLKNRKKEFGLYNILGMGKGNLIHILFWEFLITGLISIGVGLILGITFSKLFELLLLNMIQADITYSFSVSWDSVIETVLIYSGIFILLFISAAFQVSRTSTIDLLNSEKLGEKPPKGNLLLAILGILSIGGGYYISATIEDPVSALIYFFIAVIMVIIGTYMLLISGSVALCRLLQKNKNYYYKTNHFISVSSMVYRMKRNGAGLASICILATMVLVMLSSSASLFFGAEEAIRVRYPREMNLTFYSENIDSLSSENIASLEEMIATEAESLGSKQEDTTRFRNVAFTGYIAGDTVQVGGDNLSDLNLDQLDNIVTFYFVPVDDYNALTGSNETLSEDEVLIETYRTDYDQDHIAFSGGKTFKIKDQLEGFDIDGEAAMMITPSIYVITSDLMSSTEGLSSLTAGNGFPLLTYRYNSDFDTELLPEDQLEFYETFRNNVHSVENDYGFTDSSIESREHEHQNFYSLIGGLFYLGVLLSAVFICAAVLIIYYKQISEGFEDQSRFEIMQKVGLTRAEIKKSIHSQMLTVFFLPLALSALNMCFAFPIISKLLLLFNLNNVTLFAWTTVGCILVFGLFYTAVYFFTSNAYYKIVSGSSTRTAH